MKCILLCGGYSTRLYPLTLDRPKPLLPIAGKPMVEHVISRIEKLEDVDQILIVSNDKFFNNFRNWKRNFSSAKQVKILNDGTKSNEKRLGAIGDIHFAIRQEKIDDSILVVAGDNLFDFNLMPLQDFFKEKNSSVIALYDVRDKSLAARKYGVVEIDENNKITALEEKPEEPKTTLISTACYILSKEDAQELEEYMENHRESDNLGDFVKWLISKNPVYGLVFEGQWFDIGSREQLKEADIEWSSKK